MKGMIMAAGLGTRLMPLTELTSKPTVPIVNHPIMEYIVRLLAAHGVTDQAANRKLSAGVSPAFSASSSALTRRPAS